MEERSPIRTVSVHLFQVSFPTNSRRMSADQHLGVGEGSWEGGMWDYKALPLPGSEEFVDGGVGASWCHNK